jgi:hypothetical protein
MDNKEKLINTAGMIKTRLAMRIIEQSCLSDKGDSYWEIDNEINFLNRLLTFIRGE